MSDAAVTQPPLLLASGSPRRAQLLTVAGFDLEIVTPDFAEKTDPQFTARELTTWNAVGKGLSVARRHPNRAVLAGDTVVALDREIIGKPRDFDDAVQILKKLSGRSHHVYSSVFVTKAGAGRGRLLCETSQVRFRKLNEREICDYLRKIDPLDKAGAYAAQGHGAEIIASIDGSYSNVVGLPMERTVEVLKRFGVRPLLNVSRRSPFPVELQHAGGGVHAAKRGKGTRR